MDGKLQTKKKDKGTELDLLNNEFEKSPFNG